MMGIPWFLFVWTCLGILALVVSLLSDIQKLLDGGWRNFVRALAWLLTIGWLLAVPYYTCFSGSPHAADSIAPLVATSVDLKSIVGKPAGKQKPDAGATAVQPVPAIQPAEPTIVKVESVQDTRPAVVPTVAKAPPLLAWSSAAPERQPTLLPLQKTIFMSSEVLFCPRCGAAYSSKGLREDVTCPTCRNRVNLKSDSTKTVFRCVECKQLLKAPQVTRSPTLFFFHSPTKFNYFCPICNKQHSFEEH